jgi:hypothetical protein
MMQLQGVATKGVATRRICCLLDCISHLWERYLCDLRPEDLWANFDHVQRGGDGNIIDCGLNQQHAVFISHNSALPGNKVEIDTLDPHYIKQDH